MLSQSEMIFLHIYIHIYIKRKRPVFERPGILTKSYFCKKKISINALELSYMRNILLHRYPAARPKEPGAEQFAFFK